jgi:hypothetical protein
MYSRNATSRVVYERRKCQLCVCIHAREWKGEYENIYAFVEYAEVKVQ